MIGKTKELYGFLWKRRPLTDVPASFHFDKMQQVVNEPIVRGRYGLDAGCGCGYDTHLMAKNNPDVGIVSMDISDGVHVGSKINSGLKNVLTVRGSVLNAPLKDALFDFVYSFGVLHHTSDPKKGLLEIARVLKKASPVFLYLYEDHGGSIVKNTALKAVTAIRTITVRLNPKSLYVLSLIASPFVFLIFSLPAVVLFRFDITRALAQKIPFNFGRTPLSLRADLYDRFGAPIEHRFSKKELYDLLAGCDFRNIQITRLKAAAGWVAWAYKKL